MKKILVSAGLAAIGAAGLHADEYAPDVTAMDASRVWSVSGTLRGFYDSNYTTTPQSQYSWGFEVSPSISIIIPLQQTELGLRYTYGLYYYQARENQGANPIDQTQNVNLWIDHAFTERWEGKVQDVFNYGQEPQLSATGGLPYRVQSSYLQNIGTLSLHTEWSALFSTDLSYNNTLLQYEDNQGNISDPSLAGFLNQLDNGAFLNLNYQYLPDLSFLVGYQFTFNQYTAGQQIGYGQTPSDIYNSDSLNNYSQNFYLGGKYNANRNLDANVQIGATYVDNYNLPSFSTQSSTAWYPYANIALTYTYLPGSYAQLGFTEDVGASDTPNPDHSNGSITTYQLTSVVYGTINHKFTPHLTGSVIGRYQYGIYEGGASDGDGQAWYSLGLNLSYSLNEYLSLDGGWNYDYVATTSALPGYHRNVTYLGITATY
ncbi:MAG TPA: outer membrane beta-barrel protein [Pseudomonadales bacterium]|nr:outer membrane beta-barrel protein [Pseudomonadales bacterium]